MAGAAALAHVREAWEPETTARNLALILESMKRRGEETGWLQRTIDAMASQVCRLSR